MFIITTYTSEVAQSCLTLCNSTDSFDSLSESKPSSSIMGFSRQEYWSGLPFPLPWDFPDPGIEPRSPTLQATLYHLSNHGSSQLIQWTWKIGIIISIIILQKRIQRLRKVKWLMTYLNPQSSQIGRFQSYLCTSEAYTKHDMRQSL